MLASLLKLLSNIIYTTSSFTQNELSLFVYSLNNWMCKKSQKNTANYSPGTIIEYDCGLNYMGELSYRHVGIVLDESDDMILTVPATSRDSYIDKTSEKDDGVWYYILVGENEGFDHECVLMLNNIKMISKRRVIASYGNMIENNVEKGQKYFDKIKLEIMSHYFSKQCKLYENKISDLELNIKEKDEQINCLKNENYEMTVKIKEQKEKINSLYMNIERKKQKKNNSRKYIDKY